MKLLFLLFLFTSCSYRDYADLEGVTVVTSSKRLDRKDSSRYVLMNTSPFYLKVNEVHALWFIKKGDGEGVYSDTVGLYQSGCAIHYKKCDFDY